MWSVLQLAEIVADHQVAVPKRLRRMSMMKRRAAQLRSPSRDTLAEGDQIIGSKHIHRGLPEFGVVRCLCQRHIATIGAPDHTGPLRIYAFVLRQDLGHGMHMVLPVFAAKVVVYPPGIAQSIT